MHLATFIVHWLQHYRPAVQQDAGGAMENPDFGRSDNPISTKGADYAHQIIHSVSEYKKRYIRNYTQILENLRYAIVGFFGLRNEFASVQGNKKRNTQNIQVKKQKKNTHLNFSAL